MNCSNETMLSDAKVVFPTRSTMHNNVLFHIFNSLSAGLTTLYCLRSHLAISPNVR